MRRHFRTFGIVVAMTLLMAGCGENDENVIIGDNDNTDGRTPTPIVTFTPLGTPTQIVPTVVAPTETPAPGQTATPVASGGPTSTPGGPTVVVTATPGPAATATLTPTPAPTATATGPFCGNGIKEAGEECDSGASFGISTDCADECACCICRPSNTEHALGLKCSNCHPGVGAIPAIPPGAVDTFPGLCE